jgi:hypothetical protein
MVGITLSAEQIRNAPREVRQWLEQEILSTFGWQSPVARPDTHQLARCSVDDAASILSLIGNMIPVTNVFFELGHEGAGQDLQGLVAYRLTDLQRHARLKAVEQVEACLGIISDALRRVRQDADVAFYRLDDRGHCFITDETRKSISTIWHELVASRHASEGETPSDKPAVSFRPFGTSPSVWKAQAHPMGLRLSNADIAPPGNQTQP